MAKIDQSLRLSDAEIDAMVSRVNRRALATQVPGEDINLTPMGKQ